MEDRTVSTQKREYGDWRNNARIILECTNGYAFRWQCGRFFCAYCRANFPLFEDLKSHTTEHVDKSKNIEILLRSCRVQSRVKVEISNLQCEICFTSLKDVNDARKHLIDIHNKHFNDDHEVGVMPYWINRQDFGCAVCDERFQLFQRLIVHMNKHFPSNICPHCGKASSTSLLLRSHLKTHEDVKVLKVEKRCKPMLRKCQLCNARFKEHNQKMKHLREVHNFMVEYACHLCPAKFMTYRYRTAHIKRVHVRELKFSCDQCSYKCIGREALKLHMACHGGERVYKCDVCGKGFARRKTLVDHMRIHNKDKWLSCEFCDYKCAQRCSLRNHMKKRHPENNFK